METQRKPIELKAEFRGNKRSTTFAGRNEGAEVREKLSLNEKDDDKNLYVVSFASDTTSVNPSFFLGLFFPSLQHLGYENFSNKYFFDYSNFSGEELKMIIIDNINECIRKAKNELSNTSALG